MRAADYENVHHIAWHVYWSAPTSDVAAVEARCHRALAAHRFVNTTGTETYHVTHEFARAVVERLVIPPSPSTAIPLRFVSRHSSWRHWAKRAALAAIIPLELARVTRYPKIRARLSPALAGRLVNELRDLAIVVTQLPEVTLCADASDNYLLALAAAGAGRLSGDRRQARPAEPQAACGRQNRHRARLPHPAPEDAMNQIRPIARPDAPHGG